MLLFICQNPHLISIDSYQLAAVNDVEKYLEGRRMNDISDAFEKAIVVTLIVISCCSFVYIVPSSVFALTRIFCAYGCFPCSMPRVQT